MNVNGITSPTTPTYTQTAPQTANTASQVPENTSQATEGAGVIYEPSKETATANVKKTYTPDVNLINKLKADADARTAQFRSMVEKMLAGQSDAYGKANDIWKFLAGGNFTVDLETKLQAQKDIAEDGYWGVEQTSDRIIDFAKALTGGDPEKFENMKDAFEKGYKMAEKKWGGELPEISKQTYDAVLSKFDKLMEEAGFAT